MHEQKELTVTLLLRGRELTVDEQTRVAALVHAAPAERHYLSHAEFAQLHAVSEPDAASIAAFARDAGLELREIHRAKRIVRVRGSFDDFERVFQFRFRRFQKHGRAHHEPDRTPTIPAQIADIVLGVHGFENRHGGAPHFRAGKQSQRAPGARAQDGAVTSATGLDAPNIALLYNFPSDYNGAGQCIGIIALANPQENGTCSAGYNAADLELYFSALGMASPTIVKVSVDGAGFEPGSDPDGDKEISLDVQVAASVAPGARIVVYFAPNSTDGFYNGVLAAMHDTVNCPKILSISWGMPEPHYDRAWREHFSALLDEAAQLGLSVCVSSGDLGSSGYQAGDADDEPHAMFPAACALALACGGTRIFLSGAAIAGEVVWNEGDDGGASGGGVSESIAVPPWQKTLSVGANKTPLTGRGVPDLSACADGNPGYRIFFGGQSLTLSGTSAVAPLFAGFLARANQARAKIGKGPLGSIHSILYSRPDFADAFRPIVEGNNDIRKQLNVYSAAAGWNPCTGLGAPRGDVFFAKLLEV